MIIHRATTSSTQEDAKALARDGCAHGVVVRADEQTGGRGRRGRGWLSGPHGLWMSMVLRLDLPMARAPRLPLCACAAVAHVIAAHTDNGGADVFVKWPNDLVVAATTAHPLLGPFRKVGGLLIEAVTIAGHSSAHSTGDTEKQAGQGSVLRTAVLGIGLNLTTPVGGFPFDLQASAGALDDAGLRLLDPGPLAAALRLALLDVGAAADDDAFAAVRAKLAARSATLRRRVSVDGISGRAVAIADDGALLIEDDVGVVTAVHAGDVAVVPV